MTRFDFNIRRALYDGEGNEPTGDPKGESKGAEPKVLTMTQEEFDKKFTDRMKKERAQVANEKQQYISQLEQWKQTATLTEEQKSVLEQQIEDLKVSQLTKEEQARRAKEKADKEWETKHKAATEEASMWKSRHDALVVNASITQAATENKALPQAFKFIAAHLGPKTKLVEIKDEEGKPTGRYETHVRVPSTDKDGNPIELDLSVMDAVKMMREAPDDYGMLFEGLNVGGTGTKSGKPTGKVDIDKMDLNSYRETLKPKMSA